MTEPAAPSGPLIAAIRCRQGREADDALAEAAARLAAEGFRACGHVQRVAPGRGRAVTLVEDVASGLRQPITQDLGAASEGCSLDPAALAEVAGALLAALDGPVDILILNRFGRGEAEGGGLRAAVEKACVAGVPVLAVLRDDYAAAWDAFTGGTVRLEPQPEAILAWARGAIAAARAAA
jgi:hypothetical protein